MTEGTKDMVTVLALILLVLMVALVFVLIFAYIFGLAMDTDKVRIGMSSAITLISAIIIAAAIYAKR